MKYIKICKRISSFLKLKKYRKIGLRGLSSSRRVFPRVLKYNGLKRQYFLGKDQSFFFNSMSLDNGRARDPHDNRPLFDDVSKFNITKKKGGVLSYLFTVICRFPRKYVYRLLNRETFRRYYTMPLRLSMSRFVSYLTFKGYYGPKCARILRKADFLKNVSRQEAAKRAIMHIEQRLDSSALRLMRFKSLFTTKIPIRFRAHKVKSPWSILSSLQIQQFISHGHVYINGKTAQFGNMKLGICDLLRVGVVFKNRQAFIRLGNAAPSSSAMGFSKLFYMIYRNMYLADRSLTAREGGVRCTNVEKDVKLVFDVIESDKSAYLLWPVLSLLKISDFAKATKPNLLAGKNLSAKEDKWNRRSQLQRLLRWKRLQSTAKTISGQAVSISKQDPSLMYSRFSRCYASIVYGTRRCEWVKLQQRGNGRSFCEALPHKTNFLESELEYFQLLIRHYF